MNKNHLILLLFVVIVRFSPSPKKRKSAFKAVENDDENVYYLWHITDPHMDFEYQEGSEPFCLEKQCCRKKKEGQKFFAGKFGYPLSPECDSPNITYTSTLQFIRDYPIDEKRVLGVINTGDFPAHDELSQSLEGNIAHVEYGYKMMKEMFSEKGFPVFGSLGNHDSWPINELDFQPGGGYLLDLISNLWSAWITKREERDNIKHYGYYSQDLGFGLRLISLNTFWVDVRNRFMKLYPSMKHHMANWLKGELENAKKENEKVIIIGHYAPGIEGPYAYAYENENENDERIRILKKKIEKNEPVPWVVRVTNEWNHDLLNISNDYSNEILIQLYGHEHIERMIVVKDSLKQEIPKSIALITPAIETRTFSNPTVRLLKFNIIDHNLIDYITFINLIDKSNKQGKMQGNWVIEYSASDFYDSNIITPEVLQKGIEKMKINEQYYNEYESFHWSQYVNNTCLDECKVMLFCSMNYITNESYEECTKKEINNLNLLRLKKIKKKLN